MSRGLGDVYKRQTVRSMGGNFGTDKTLYEIMVGEKDYDNAMGILTALK